jgi:predicted nucleotidyltransferase
MTTRTFTEQETELLRRIRETVRAVEPTAQVILYGSRARGDAAPDSDWDLLVLLDGPVDLGRKRALSHRLYELEWDTGDVLSLVIRERAQWESSLYRAMPFHWNVTREGIAL